MSHDITTPEEFEANIYNIQAGVEDIPGVSEVRVFMDIRDYEGLKVTLMKGFCQEVFVEDQTWERVQNGIKITITFS